MSSTCDICGRIFAKPFNLRRHKREVHGHISNDDNVLISTYAVLQHPFTCIVAGCTQSGKTVWVKTLLENAQKTISLPPQRIIWCYGQWQPSYFDMMKTMPGIEFNQGIHEDIDGTRLFGCISAQPNRFGRFRAFRAKLRAFQPSSEPYNAKLQLRAFRAKIRAFRAKLRAFRAKLRAFRAI